jgi:hypothetical protein
MVAFVLIPLLFADIFLMSATGARPFRQGEPSWLHRTARDLPLQAGIKNRRC